MNERAHPVIRPSSRTAHWLSLVLLCGLLLFAVSQFLPISGKSVNNVAYALILLPALLALVSSPSNLERLHAAAWPLLFFFAAVLVGSALQGEVGFVKSVIYVFLFCAAIIVSLRERPRAAAQIYLCFALLALGMLLQAAYGGLTGASQGEGLVRQQLWGRSENPIYAGLLVVSAIVFLWTFALERHCRRSPVALLGGLCLTIGLALLAIVVFQSRSALMGLVLYFVFYMAFRGYARQAGLLVVVFAAALFFGVYHEAILVRGLSYRPEIWLDALTTLYSECNFLIGCGKTDELFVGQFWGSHSAYIGTLYRHGLIGAAGFAVFAIWYMHGGIRARSDWFLVSLVGWGGMSTAMDGFIGGPDAWWVFFWFPTIAAIAERQLCADASTRPPALRG